MKRFLVRYQLVRDEITDADLLLFRPSPRSLLSRLICAVGRSAYCHAAMAARLNGHVTAIEVREWIGGRTVDLLHLVEQNPGRIDVFRPCRELLVPGRAGGPIEVRQLHPKAAVEEMLRICRPGEYGYLGCAKAYLRHLPFIRWWLPVEYDVDDQAGPPFCSQAYAEAIRRTFCDPVPNLPARLVEPGDLARSPLLANYQFTLEP